MFPEPRNDTLGFTPSAQPCTSDPTTSSTTDNESSGGYYHDFHSSFAFKNTIDYVVLFTSLCGLAGNGIVIWLLGFRIPRNPFSVYILNLAVADFLYLLGNSIHILCNFLSCTHMFYLATVTSGIYFYMGSLSFLAAIGSDRSLSVLCPLWYRCRRPEHLSAVVCALSWGASLCLVLLVIAYICLLPSTESHKAVLLPFSVWLFVVFLVFCVSSLILVIKVQCCSRSRQLSGLYLVTSLTALAFLVFGLPVGAIWVACGFSPLLRVSFKLYYISYLLSVVNSSVNPVIYFFIGRMRQQQRQTRLREVLQASLMDNAETSGGWVPHPQTQCDAQQSA